MLFKYIGNFRWKDVFEKPYKTNDNSFLNVKRFEIVKGKDVEFRYFEIEKGGYSSLERHEHEHIVMFIKGRGIVLIENEIYEFEPFDIVYIPSFKAHRFVAKYEDIGFICVVKKDRDKPQKLNEEEIKALIEKNPNLKEFLKFGV
jgi:quercetin dioxygenase-like cupin family protein